MTNVVLTNNLLTKEEIDQLAINFPCKTEEINNYNDPALKLERAIKYFNENSEKFAKLPLEEIFKWFYYLGVNTDPQTKNVSIEDVVKMFEEAEFFKSVYEYINNPKKLPENTIVDVDDENNVIRLETECKGYECECSPQREDHCVSEDPEKCIITIPMNKFNKMIGIKN